jgi:hypothetical protein
MLALGAEYTRRYGKHHLTIAKCREVLANVPHAIHTIDFCDPPQCMPDEYKMADAVDGYQKYYEFGKAHLKDK